MYGQEKEKGHLVRILHTTMLLPTLIFTSILFIFSPLLKKRPNCVIVKCENNIMTQNTYFFQNPRRRKERTRPSWLLELFCWILFKMFDLYFPTSFQMLQLPSDVLVILKMIKVNIILFPQSALFSLSTFKITDQSFFYHILLCLYRTKW